MAWWDQIQQFGQAVRTDIPQVLGNIGESAESWYNQTPLVHNTVEGAIHNIKNPPKQQNNISSALKGAIMPWTPIVDAYKTGAKNNTPEALAKAKNQDWANKRRAGQVSQGQDLAPGEFTNNMIQAPIGLSHFLGQAMDYVDPTSYFEPASKRHEATDKARHEMEIGGELMKRTPDELRAFHSPRAQQYMQIVDELQRNDKKDPKRDKELRTALDNLTKNQDGSRWYITDENSLAVSNAKKARSDYNIGQKMPGLTPDQLQQLQQQQYPGIGLGIDLNKLFHDPLTAVRPFELLSQGSKAIKGLGKLDDFTNGSKEVGFVNPNAPTPTGLGNSFDEVSNALKDVKVKLKEAHQVGNSTEIANLERQAADLSNAKKQAQVFDPEVIHNEIFPQEVTPKVVPDEKLNIGTEVTPEQQIMQEEALRQGVSPEVVAQAQDFSVAEKPLTDREIINNGLTNQRKEEIYRNIFGDTQIDLAKSIELDNGVQLPVKFRNPLDQMLAETFLPRSKKYLEKLGLPWQEFDRSVSAMRDDVYKPLAQLMLGKTDQESVRLIEERAAKLYNTIKKRAVTSKGREALMSDDWHSVDSEPEAVRALNRLSGNDLAANEAGRVTFNSNAPMKQTVLPNGKTVTDFAIDPERVNYSVNPNVNPTLRAITKSHEGRGHLPQVLGGESLGGNQAGVEDYVVPYLDNLVRGTRKQSETSEDLHKLVNALSDTGYGIDVVPDELGANIRSFKDSENIIKQWMEATKSGKVMPPKLMQRAKEIKQFAKESPVFNELLKLYVKRSKITNAPLGESQESILDSIYAYQKDVEDTYNHPMTREHLKNNLDAYKQSVTPERELAGSRGSMTMPFNVKEIEAQATGQNYDSDISRMVDEISSMSPKGRNEFYTSPETNPEFKRHSIIGVKGSRTSELEQKALAEQLEKEGKDATDIFLTTGWERGIDGKWRTEIQDSKIDIEKLMTLPARDDYDNVVYLPEVYDHPELYSRYPKLKKMTVHSIPDDSDSAGEYRKGVFKSSSGSIGFNPRFKDPTTLVHEIQHAIQTEEGFPRGANPNQFKDTSKEQREYKEAHKAWTDNRLKELEDLKKLAETRKEKYAINKEMDEVRSNKFRPPEREGVDLSSRYDKYFQSAGEVEARNVQTRYDLSPESKKSRPFSSTEDVKRDRQKIWDSSNLTSKNLPKLSDDELFDELSGLLMNQSQSMKLNLALEKLAKEHPTQRDDLYTLYDNLVQNGQKDSVRSLKSDPLDHEGSDYFDSGNPYLERTFTAPKQGSDENPFFEMLWPRRWAPEGSTTGKGYASQAVKRALDFIRQKGFNTFETTEQSKDGQAFWKKREDKGEVTRLNPKGVQEYPKYKLN